MAGNSRFAEVSEEFLESLIECILKQLDNSDSLSNCSLVHINSFIEILHRNPGVRCVTLLLYIFFEKYKNI